MEKEKRKKQKVLMPAGIRSKLMAAASMLMVGVIMMVSSTYAWFTLSTAPEVKNISTTVAGNGSLEIALMPESGNIGNISAGAVGSNADAKTSNTKWGNLVDLSDVSYGLSSIKLYPAQLNTTTADGTVTFNENGSSPLSIPVYGGDGRIDSTSAENIGLRTYKDGGFSGESYGVRAIGEVNNGVVSSTYGYVVDLALRLNTQNLKTAGETTSAVDGKLLLQTAEMQRIYSDSGNADTLGGGSYMSFTANGLEPEAVKKLMGAIRVTFVQNYGKLTPDPTILGTAKLDVSTDLTADANGEYKANLYLYSADGTKLDQDKAVLLNAMEKNIACQISAIVWLDGSSVTNAEVAASEAMSLSGKLNLQFSTDVKLNPAANAPLKGE